MQKLSIDDRMESAAEHGLMEVDLFLWKHTIKRLKKNGLDVKELFESQRKGEFYCKISWKNPKEGFVQVNNLHEMALNR